jgi:predicted transcriptional regulator
MSTHLNIGLRSATERRRSLRETAKRLRDGARKGEDALYFENIEDLRKVLTGKRLQLLRAVVERKPDSVNHLARLLKRNYKNVSQDVALLHRLGLLSIESSEGNGIARAPTVPYDEIRLTIPVATPAKRAQAGNSPRKAAR